MPKLLNFDVAVEPLGDGYRTGVIASPAGEAQADFVLPFDDRDLTILVLDVIRSVGEVRRNVRRIESPERRRVEAFGSSLFDSVFSGPVRECLARSQDAAENKDAGLRIRLRVPGALANIPWEYLYDADHAGFVGLSTKTALVRYIEMPSPVRPFPIRPPLRILAMISAPSDVPALQGDDEWRKLNTALDSLARQGMVQVERLEAGTLSALQRPLRLSEYHVLHFIGHGGWDESAQDGALALEDRDGRTRLVTGRDLGTMIRDHRSLRLVVLNACEGARSAQDDPFGGVAQALVHQGIPAVIAMQFEISDPAALMFSQSFYQAIADGSPVDVAMAEARMAIFADGNDVEWATPVLYLRSPDGQVFTSSRAPEAARKAREEAGRKAQEEAGRKAREEAGRKAREEAGRKAREEAALKAREHLESLGYMTLAAIAKRLGLVVPGTRRELIKLLLAQPTELLTAAERQAQEEADRKMREEADRKMREEADRKARRVVETQAPPTRGDYAPHRTDKEPVLEALKRDRGPAAARPADPAIVRVYDPAQARMEAESVKSIMEKYNKNLDPEFRVRALDIKEQRSELVKQHLCVLWTDYFKPEHFQRYPQLHQLFNEATKLAGFAGTKGSTDVATADKLLAKIQEISKIFWETKLSSVP